MEQKYRKALLIGINKYCQNPLHYCVADILALGERLVKNGDGSDNFDVSYLSNVKTSIEAMNAIKKLFMVDDEKESDGDENVDTKGSFLVDDSILSFSQVCTYNS